MSAAGRGIGARLPRKEDARFLAGRGDYVANFRMAGMRDVAFVRSPVAHAQHLSVTKPQGHEDAVFVMDDLAGVQPIRGNAGLPGFRASEQFPLARGKVRHVGEMIAMCVAGSRAEAEDLAAQVTVEFDELPAVPDMLAALEEDAPRLHEHWPDNVFLESTIQGDLSAIAASAPVRVRRQLRTARQCMSPMEGRGCVAYLDRRLDQLVLVTAAQMPHINRTGLAECLGMDEGRIRVVAPDVGGGFGYKGILLPEEICVAWLALKHGRPVRWIEDRREQLTANANCREHWYDITVYAGPDGALLGVECEALVDAGAYSSYPFSAALEPGQVTSILPGPYRMHAYRCRTRGVATSKPPILPYRGVARAGVCYAIETMLDAVAKECRLEPHEVRMRNLVPSSDMPYTNITNKIFDSGDYPECLRRAVAALDLPRWRARQRAAPADRPIGIGLAVYCEQAAHGTSVYFGWGIPMVPGFEQCFARMTPDGVLELRIGAHSHGQGLETSLAQVANTVLGIDPGQVRLVHGDTSLTPYSTGTWGSRCMVMAGGAVATACAQLGERLKHIAAKLLEVAPGDLELAEDGIRVAGTDRRISLREAAQVWYRKPQLLPADVDPAGLETTAGYRTVRDTGTFSYATHACVVEVDTGTGGVSVLDYVIVEDGGVLVNPLIVDGQIYGGLAQGIGTALYEEMPFDEFGQPLASTLADYLLPGPAEVPEPRLDHMETPSPISYFGQKGIGEGGAIGPPAALGNAINDAIAGTGARIDRLPMTPRVILDALREARRRAA